MFLHYVVLSLQIMFTEKEIFGFTEMKIETVWANQMYKMDGRWQVIFVWNEGVFYEVGPGGKLTNNIVNWRTRRFAKMIVIVWTLQQNS